MTPKFLIVEDDPDIVHAMAIRLKAQGYNLVFATDAISAISVARKEKPDLVILDLGLPAGDGFMVMKRLQALPDFMLIPVIIVSARDPMFNEPLAREAGAQAYLQKPFEAAELLSAVQDALSKAAAQKAWVSNRSKA